VSLYGSGVEYGLHCLLYLVGAGGIGAPSARDLAEFQGVSPSYVAKLFTQLEKSGLVVSAEGVRGGYRLARPPGEITILQVVDALEGEKPLFQCREIRGRCVLFEGPPPQWATSGMCGIHAIMREAELQMRATLAARTLADLSASVSDKLPPRHADHARQWFQARIQRRRRAAKQS
jgi:Rrf2 family protein